MNDTFAYHIRLRGQVDGSEINVMSPLEITVERADAGATLFTVCTDQSGLVGLLRHLHGLGFVFLFVSRAGTDEVEVRNAMRGKG